MKDITRNCTLRTIACIETVSDDEWLERALYDHARSNCTCADPCIRNQIVDPQASEVSRLDYLSNFHRPMAFRGPMLRKTVLAKYLIDVLAESSTVCFFFLKQDSSEQSNITNALCAILHQLICQNPPLTRHVANACRYRGAQSLAQFNAVWDILVEAATDSRAGPITCIIDGIDECLEQERRSLLSSLSKFLCSKDSEKSCLKLILTGRPYASIEREFYKIPQSEQIHIRAEDEHIHVWRDVNALITFRIKELAHLKNLSQQSQDKLEDHLLRNAGTNFLWVTLVLDLIEESPRASDKQIKKILSSTPETLDDIYEQILSKSPDPVEAKRLLHLIAGARRPLKLQEINVALSISDEDRSMSDIDLEPSIKNTVRELCGLFLHITNETAYFVHQTAFDFIVRHKVDTESNLRDTNDGLSTQKTWKGCVDMKAAHSMLAKICIQVLHFPECQETHHPDDDETDSLFSISSSSSMLYEWPPLPQEAFTPNSDDPTYDFLGYCAGNWFSHFDETNLAECQQAAQDAIALCEPSGPFFRIWSGLLDNGGLYIYWSLSDMGSYKPSALSTMVWARLTSLLPLYLKAPNHDLNSLIPFKGETPLQYAISQGDEAVALVLINGDVDVDIQDYEGETALHLACRKRQHIVVQRLLEKGASVNVENDKRQVPIYLAVNAHRDVVEEARFPIVELLLTFGANLNPHSPWQPLFPAVKHGNHKLARLLLENGVTVKSTYRQQTALHVVEEEEDREMIELLLAFGPDAIDSQDPYGVTPLRRFHLLSSPNFFVLLEHGADPNIVPDDGMPLLIVNISDGYESWIEQPAIKVELERLLFDIVKEHGVALECRDLNKINALEAAMERETKKKFHAQKYRQIKRLIEAGADPNAVDHSHPDRRNCLQYAVVKRDGQSVEILLEAGADVNAADIQGATPLIQAVRSADAKIVLTLLKAGADPNAKGDHHGPALTNAVILDSLNGLIVSLLLEYGADPNLVGGMHGCPLVAAAICGRYDTTGLLISYGADVDIHVGAPHGTPLIAAATRYLEGMVSLLLANGADPMRAAVTDDGRIFWPYSVAEDHKAENAMRLLMWNGAKSEPAAAFEFENDFKEKPEVEEYVEDREQYRAVGLPTEIEDIQTYVVRRQGTLEETSNPRYSKVPTASQRANAASQASNPRRPSGQTGSTPQQATGFQLRLTWPGE
jgi:ankyrin repeat protein